MKFKNVAMGEEVEGSQLAFYEGDELKARYAEHWPERNRDVEEMMTIIKMIDLLPPAAFSDNDEDIEPLMLALAARAIACAAKEAFIVLKSQPALCPLSMNIALIILNAFGDKQKGVPVMNSVLQGLNRMEAHLSSITKH